MECPIYIYVVICRYDDSVLRCVKLPTYALNISAQSALPTN